MSLAELIDISDGYLLTSLYYSLGILVLVITALLRIIREGFDGKIKHRIIDIILVLVISAAFLLSYTMLLLDSLITILLIGVIAIRSCYLFLLNMIKGYNRERDSKESKKLLILHMTASLTGWFLIASATPFFLLWPELIFGIFLWTAILFYQKDELLRLSLRLNLKEEINSPFPEFARNSLLQILIISSVLPFCLGLVRMARFIHRNLPLHYYL